MRRICCGREGGGGGDLFFLEEIFFADGWRNIFFRGRVEIYAPQGRRSVSREEEKACLLPLPHTL